LVVDVGYILITGGVSNGPHTRKTEILTVPTESTICAPRFPPDLLKVLPLADYPFDTTGAIGVFIDGAPTVCGGFHEDR